MPKHCCAPVINVWSLLEQQSSYEALIKEEVWQKRFALPFAFPRHAPEKMRTGVRFTYAWPCDKGDAWHDLHQARTKI